MVQDPGLSLLLLLLLSSPLLLSLLLLHGLTPRMELKCKQIICFHEIQGLSYHAARIIDLGGLPQRRGPVVKGAGAFKHEGI